METPAKPLPRPGRREDILAAATQLFSRHGVHAVTTRQIAAAVGISQPSLYAHFASVQTIQDEVSSRAFALLDQMCAPRPGAPAQDQLRQTVAGCVAFGLNNPDAYRIAFLLEHAKPAHAAGDAGASVWDGEACIAADHPGPRIFGLLRQILAQLRPDLPDTALMILCQSLWATLHGLVSLLIARPDFPWADRGRLIADHSRRACAMVMIP